MSEVCLSNSFPLTVQFGYIFFSTLWIHRRMPFFWMIICIFFRSGGAELLFNKTKKHDLILPQQDNPCWWYCLCSSSLIWFNVSNLYEFRRHRDSESTYSLAERQSVDWKTGIICARRYCVSVFRKRWSIVEFCGNFCLFSRFQAAWYFSLSQWSRLGITGKYFGLFSWLFPNLIARRSTFMTITYSWDI